MLIKEPFSGEKFTSFIEELGECCLIFDEFGKMYPTNKRISDGGASQEDLLMLMDGVDKTKRLIILSENDMYSINEFMINRPSRIYYHFKYTKLDEDSIRGYCEDHNIPETITLDIIEVSRQSTIFSFDILQAIVEEYNRFGESVDTAIDCLNIDLRRNTYAQMQIMSVVTKSDNVAKQINGKNIVNKPGSGYTYLYINNDNHSDYVENEVAVASTIDDVPAPPSKQHRIEVCFSDDELVYETQGKSIYETSEYIITTMDVINTPINYRNTF